MTYEIALVPMPEEPVLSIREQTTIPGLRTLIGSAFHRLFGEAGTLGATVAAAPFLVYHAVGPEGVDAEVCMPLDRPHPADRGLASGIAARTIEAHDSARTVHRGRYERLGEAYAALDDWIRSHDYANAGPVRETYLNGPDDVATPDEYLTRIDMPVARAAVAAGTA